MVKQFKMIVSKERSFWASQLPFKKILSYWHLLPGLLLEESGKLSAHSLRAAVLRAHGLLPSSITWKLLRDRNQHEFRAGPDTLHGIKLSRELLSTECYNLRINTLRRFCFCNQMVHKWTGGIVLVHRKKEAYLRALSPRSVLRYLVFKSLDSWLVFPEAGVEEIVIKRIKV